MREYRKRKREIRTTAPVSVPSTPSIVRAPEPSSVSGRTIEKPSPLHTCERRVRAKGARTSFRTALELARTFPFGVLASQACPYCYNTGYSSPGTRCSYCRRGEK